MSKKLKYGMVSSDCSRGTNSRLEDLPLMWSGWFAIVHGEEGDWLKGELAIVGEFKGMSGMLS